ncbi:MAG: hypothetical protein WCD35_14940, partial [Mycobacteriales bacterium]
MRSFVVFPGRRYAPFAAVVFAQLLLVAVAPSKGREVTAPQYAAVQDPAAAGALPGPQQAAA